MSNNKHNGFVVIYGNIYNATLVRVNTSQATFTTMVEDGDTLHVHYTSRFTVAPHVALRPAATSP